MATLPAAPGSCHVVDVGAGAGKLTAVLAEAGFDVDAVEPDARMRAVLVDRLPGVRVQAGRGEALPLADASMNAVVYGNSWHWVNAAAGAEEAARVLRPGGVLAILWNYEDDGNAWFSAFERIVGIRSRGLPGSSR